MITKKEGILDVHCYTVQLLADINGCVIEESEGWDNRHNLHYSEATLNYIVKFKEFYDINAVIKASADAKKQEPFLNTRVSYNKNIKGELKCQKMK
jgi:hypothetical protein